MTSSRRSRDRYESTDPDQELSAHQEEIEAAVARYTEAYRSYGVAVRGRGPRGGRHARASVSRLWSTFDDDPQSRWWADEVFSNPLQWDGDELIFQLWSDAHDVVPLPNVDIRIEGP